MNQDETTMATTKMVGNYFLLKSSKVFNKSLKIKAKVRKEIDT